MKDAAETNQARVVLVCCAADAQPARIHLAGGPAAAASGVPADTWLKIEGRVRDGVSVLSSNFIPTLAGNSCRSRVPLRTTVIGCRPGSTPS